MANSPEAILMHDILTAQINTRKRGAKPKVLRVRLMPATYETLRTAYNEIWGRCQTLLPASGFGASERMLYGMRVVVDDSLDVPFVVEEDV